MALNAAKVRARVVCTISTPGHFCLFFPDAVMNGDRLSGRYCALETADQSERAANDRRKTVANPAARHVRTHGLRPKPRSLYVFCSPVLVYGRLISARGFETMALNNALQGPTTPSKGDDRGNAMPIVKADRLTRISAALLHAAGASEEEADAVAVGCVNANLAGHDSHGA